MTIREDFIKSCLEAMATPNESAEIQKSQATAAEKWARVWIEHNSMEFKLFKLGFAAGTNATAKHIATELNNGKTLTKV
jgi:hypothetical protein